MSPENNINNAANFLAPVQQRGEDRLLEYIQAMGPEMAARLSKPSTEAARMMERHLTGIVGTLPAEHFNVSVTTSREQLGHLLASAMLNGYFLHAAEQRLQVESALQDVADDERE